MTRYVRARAIRTWTPIREARNEALDVGVYNFAALSGLIMSGVRLDDEARHLAELAVGPVRKATGAAPIRSKFMARA